MTHANELLSNFRPSVEDSDPCYTPDFPCAFKSVCLSTPPHPICFNVPFIHKIARKHHQKINPPSPLLFPGCQPLPLKYLDWADVESIVAVVFSCVGILITSFVTFVFIQYRDTPVVKSSSRELCYIILAGIFLGYICPFTLIARPTVASCYLQRLLVGLSSAMCYSALVTKTNRIARILAGSKKKICTRKPRFMSAWAQVIIAFMLISVQLTLEITLIILEPPEPIKSYPSIREVYLICNTSNVGMVAPLGYNGLLIMSCTYYAFKTRNVPANFNEAKYIAFTMYTTCIIWLAFVPIYFGSNYKIITTSFSVSLSVTVALGCMFTPKMYIIIAKPERNVRSAFTTSDVVRMHVGDGKSAVPSGSNSFLNMFRRKKPGSGNAKWVNFYVVHLAKFSVVSWGDWLDWKWQDA